MVDPIATIVVAIATIVSFFATIVIGVATIVVDYDNCDHITVPSIIEFELLKI